LVAFDGLSGKFVTIQLKASTATRFSLDAKYERRAAIIAYVFGCRSAAPEVYALTYGEVCKIAEEMGYTKSPSWIGKRGYSVVVGKGQRGALEPFRATPERWRLLVSA
jgi:hypothetical protein